MKPKRRPYSRGNVKGAVPFFCWRGGGGLITKNEDYQVHWYETRGKKNHFWITSAALKTLNSAWRCGPENVLHNGVRVNGLTKAKRKKSQKLPTASNFFVKIKLLRCNYPWWCLSLRRLACCCVFFFFSKPFPILLVPKRYPTVLVILYCSFTTSGTR